jgi:hypothetical protein
MSIGYPQTKDTIDQKAGTVVLQTRQALEQAHQFKTYLDSKTEAELVALGYTSAEVTTLKAGITDLDSLYLVANAQRTVVANNDFFFNGRKLTGVV